MCDSVCSSVSLVSNFESSKLIKFGINNVSEAKQNAVGNFDLYTLGKKKCDKLLTKAEPHQHHKT
jgi:hypothetical protein